MTGVHRSHQSESMHAICSGGIELATNPSYEVYLPSYPFQLLSIFIIFFLDPLEVHTGILDRFQCSVPHFCQPCNPRSQGLALVSFGLRTYLGMWPLHTTRNHSTIKHHQAGHHPYFVRCWWNVCNPAHDASALASSLAHVGHGIPAFVASINHHVWWCFEIWTDRLHVWIWWDINLVKFSSSSQKADILDFTHSSPQALWDAKPLGQGKRDVISHTWTSKTMKFKLSCHGSLDPKGFFAVGIGGWCIKCPSTWNSTIGWRSGGDVRCATRVHFTNLFQT